MIEAGALLTVLAGAAWLAFIAVLCAMQPQRAQRALAAMGSTWGIQFGEQIPRGIVGAAMVVHAPLSKLPEPFAIAGWFILVSSIIILLLPMRWHNGYARWWAARIPLLAYRAFALPTLATAVLLTYITL